MSASHIAPQNKPKEVAGVLFDVSTSWGAVQVLGIPFKHGGRVWAVFTDVTDQAVWPKWIVADVETGAQIPGVVASSPDDARLAAVEAIDSAGADKIANAVADIQRRAGVVTTGRGRTNKGKAGTSTSSAEIHGQNS